MCRCGLRYLVVRLGFNGMHYIREFHGVLYEKHRYIVPYQIKITFVRIEFYGKPAYIAGEIGRTSGAGNRGKTDENRCFPGRVCEEFRTGIRTQAVIVTLEITMSSRPACMHDPL